MTRQNSALVEESAATAKALEHQTRAMSGHVSYFRLDNAQGASVVGAQTACPAD